MLNEFHLNQKDWQELPNTRQHTQSYLKNVVNTSMTAQGVIESSMTRGIPYTFIKIGKWLERAENGTAFERHLEKNRKESTVDTATYYYWLTALQFLNGYDAYIKEHPPTMDSKSVLRFMIQEETFPVRSVTA